MNQMAFEVTIPQPFGTARERVIEALELEGFGVLTRIDVHDTLKARLGVDFREYAILGACNPQLAHKALSNRPEAGLMPPCNVIVEAVDGGTLVRIVDLRAMMATGGFEDDPTLREVGSEAADRLRRVADDLAS
jgi:uncharacterized protein (DUF302 family)